MIGLWIAVALLATALGLLLLLSLRPGLARAGRASYDLRVYRDQLDEVARDRDRGLIGEEQAAAASAEIQRRILALADRPQTTMPEASPPQRAIVIAAAVLTPLAAVALYLGIGSPAAPDRPFAARPPAAQAVEHSQEMLDMVERLAARLKTAPGDAEGWLLLARSYVTMDRYAEAVDAYRAAIQHSNRRPDIVSAYGEARVMAGGGRVDDETMALFDEVMAKTDVDPRAWFYGALGQAQRGNLPAALQLWFDLAAVSPPDAPWLPDLRERIDGISTELGTDPAMLTPSARAQAVLDGKGPLAPPPAAVAAPAPAAAPKGPTREDMDAALGMSPDDRQAMIRGMVEGLAARLEQNPGDLDGWTRLERAYRVLGETAKADQAAARIAALRAPPVATPRGPTPQDMENAATMTPEQRAELIQGMVGGLVARLQANPNDLQGWTMLERSYRVLGETAKADEALKRIQALQGK